MTKAVANIANTLAIKLGMGEVGNELIVTLKQTAFKGEATDAQFTALLVVANQYGLNPWTREIYAFPDKQNGIVPVVGVDGWSRIINEHKQFDGMDFEMSEDGSECTCTIFRKDRAHPIRVTEYFDECNRPAFKNKQGYEIKGPWQSHPRRMLRHKAMIQCARLAFGYTGIFDEDEAERITEKDVTAEGSHQTQTAIEAAQASQQPQSKDSNIYAELNTIASTQGLMAYQEAWQKLTPAQRKAIGTKLHNDLKETAAAYDDANPPIEHGEQMDDSHQEFVDQMEGKQ